MGVPAALHLNARTDRDWDRWREYIAGRPEVTHVAYEFATGAGWPNRIDWHVAQLSRLSADVGRPLHLTVRGGAKALPRLIAPFSDITILETTAFFKTMNRQRGKINSSGAVTWSTSPTPIGAMLDDLLAENWQAVSSSYAKLLGETEQLLEAAG